MSSCSYRLGPSWRYIHHLHLHLHHHIIFIIIFISFSGTLLYHTIMWSTVLYQKKLWSIVMSYHPGPLPYLPSFWSIPDYKTQTTRLSLPDRDFQAHTTRPRLPGPYYQAQTTRPIQPDPDYQAHTTRLRLPGPDYPHLDHLFIHADSVASVAGHHCLDQSVG